MNKISTKKSDGNFANTVLADAVFRPILFSTPMVQAILDGRKTQTRRIIKSKHESGLFQVCSRKSDGQITEITSLDWDERPKNDSSNDIQPLAKVGDILWVRETFQPIEHPELKYRYKADHSNPKSVVWKPSIFMPKNACRIFLEVTAVKVERVQDISEQDAKSEGVNKSGNLYYDYMREIEGVSKETFFREFSAKISFFTLWCKINGVDSWKANPWVWVYEFKRIERPLGFC